ncbi:TPA: hypothetical protein ACPV0A_001427 [Vibrio parahaemolyticus]
MKIKQVKSAFILMLATVAIVGCSSRPTKITTMETGVPADYEALPITQASAFSFDLFNVIPIRRGSREVRAREDVLKKSGGEDIINPMISSGFFWTPIGNFERITIQGTPIRKKSNLPPQLAVE